MDKIKFLYVENIISRKHKKLQQQLTFFIQVENVAYDKSLDVVWAGEDGVWHELAAEYHSLQGYDKEYWQAQVNITASEQQSLLGNVQFGIRYRVFDREYWDNNQGQNYHSEADSGVMLAHHQLVQNIHFASALPEQAEHIPMTVAVDSSFNAEKVIIQWTTDNWLTVEETPCKLRRQYWDKEHKSSARNPNQYGVELWSGQIKSGDAFRLQYVISCERDGKILWENNHGHNYSFQREQLKVLILNLHCYQEENQDEKFTQIAQTINEQEIDIICFQEVAEYWRDGQGDWESNAVKIINDRLEYPYHLHTDWSHLGFDQFREGVAILSRFPLSHHESQYVSESDDIYNIHSRNVVLARVHVPYIGALNVFSAHLSWMEDGFQQQFQRLHEWAEARDHDEVKATLLCGDFNVVAGSEGYQFVVDCNHYDDQYLAANQQGIFEKIFRVNDPHWQGLLAEDYRIDYIFMNKTSQLQVTSAKVLFTAEDYGQVSDHCGYLMTFEPKIISKTAEEG